MSHISVLLTEVLNALSPKDGEVLVDGTFGAGGYTQGILDAADCSVIGLDRDPAAAGRASSLNHPNFDFRRGCFGDVEALLDGQQVDGFVLDIGVSSFHLDEADRGFSFAKDGPLDMRMDPSQGQSAADIVNTTPEDELANIIYQYGEERKSRRVARAIVQRRAEAPFATTLDLADTVRSVVPKAKDKIDPATRTFQALRIAVNDELGELQRALDAAPRILKPGGRLVVVSFHSLEDRIVKREMRALAGLDKTVSRYVPINDTAEPAFTLPHKKAVTATAEEIAQNPRSRSARLRIAVKKVKA